MKGPIAMAIAVFALCAVVLKWHFLQEWPAPNFVNWSASFDHVFQLTNKQSIRFTHDLDLGVALRNGYGYNDSDYQASAASQSTNKPFHLMHIPPWALVPDRVQSVGNGQCLADSQCSEEPTHTKSKEAMSDLQLVAGLHSSLAEVRQRWAQSLALWSERVSVRSTEAAMDATMSTLDSTLRQWIRNVSQPLFNASQMIFSYQMSEYSDELLLWVQNTGTAAASSKPSADEASAEHLPDADNIETDDYGYYESEQKSDATIGDSETGRGSVAQGSNEDLRFHYERTRGWPTLHRGHLHRGRSTQRTLAQVYADVCQQIVDNWSPQTLQFSEDSGAQNAMEDASEQCALFLDRLLPWLPDLSPAIGSMWPSEFEMNPNSDAFGELSRSLQTLEGFKSPYTQVISQRLPPTGEPMLYVSANGSEQIAVEWFHPTHKLRATNIAFVRRIRIHLKRLTQALDDSISIKEFEDEYGWFYGHETKEDKKRDERFTDAFVQFIESYCVEAMKGQFDRVLRIDATQRFPVFVHFAPTVPALNDGGVKRLWTLALGTVIPKHELDTYVSVLRPTDLARGKSVQNVRRIIGEFGLGHVHSGDDDGDDSGVDQLSVDLIITALWPYALGGYLRAKSPELAYFSYPSLSDAARLRIPRRLVFVADVLDSVYKPPIRRLMRQRLLTDGRVAAEGLDFGFANLTQYLSVEQSLVHFVLGVDGMHSGIGDTLSVALIKTAAIAHCADAHTGDSLISCAVAGYLYNVFEAFVRDDECSQMAVAILESVGAVSWRKEATKDMFSFDLQPLLTMTRDSFAGDLRAAVDLHTADDAFAAKYRRLLRSEIRDKYAVLRRPGEDSFYF